MKKFKYKFPLNNQQFKLSYNEALKKSPDVFIIFGLDLDKPPVWQITSNIRDLKDIQLSLEDVSKQTFTE